MPVQPSVPFDRLHPPGTVLAPRSSLDRARWLRMPSWRLDSLTGTAISCLGSMPLICHAGVATSEILDFLETAGLERPRTLRRYRTESEAVALAHECVAGGARLAYFYPPLPGADAPEMLLLSIESYGFFNNKARLGEFVPSEHVPPRRFVDAAGIAGLRDHPPPHAVFLKAAVEGANGAGKDLRYCPDAPSWRDAIAWLLTEQEHLMGLIVEDAVPVASTWCLSFGVLPERALYLGAAEQIFSEVGVQEGSRIDPSNPPPPEVEAVSRSVAENARTRGYLGLCGFDVGVDSAGRILVFDLNFRMNSSTPQVLMHAAAAARTGNPVSQSFGSVLGGPLEKTLARLRPYVEAGRLLPLRIFDGSLSDGGNAPSFISGLVLAEDAARAAAVEREVSDLLADGVAG